MDGASPLLPLRSSRLGGSLRALFAWWSRELRAMVPAPLRRMLRGRGHVLLVDVTNRVAIIRRVRAQGEEEIGRILLENADAANRRAQFAIYADQVPGGSRQVIVRVPAARVLRKVLDLPVAAQENLPRTVADPAIEIVQSLGLGVTRLEVMTEGPRAEAPAGASVDFLPAPAGAAVSVRRRPLIVALAAVLGLLVGAMVMPLQQQRRLIEALEAEVATAKVKADATRKRQAEMEQAVAQSNFIINRKRDRPPFVDVLDELTTLLPDNTWLIRVRYYNGELQAFGNSPSSSALVGVLEASPLFADAQFRAPVTRDPRLNIERFHIGAQVVSPEKAEPSE